MKTIKGDLIKLAKDDNFDVIVHGCNCLHIMGAGIAKQIKHHFPSAYLADLKTPYHDQSKLGTISYTTVKTNSNKPLVVVNGYI